MKHLICLLVAASLGWACTTSPKKSPNNKTAKSDKTTVLFLVDGLGAHSLKEALKAHSLPNLSRHFNITSSEFQVGRASFPTMTYPNITSLLTTHAIDQHPIIGNQIVLGKRKIDFELPINYTILNKSVEPFSIFQKLKERNQTSASFSYLFGQNATYHQANTLSDSLEYKFKEYLELDLKLVKSLESFLKKQPAAEWPRFIYVHLIGFDGHAHLYGPNADKTLSYLAKLDSSLEKVFKVLEKGNTTEHPVETILTADHGFVDSHNYIDIDRQINAFGEKITTLNEHRHMAFYRTSKLSDDAFSKHLDPILKTPGLDFVAQRYENSILIKSLATSFEIKYGPQICPQYSFSIKVGASEKFLCPDEFDSEESNSEFPYLITNLSVYFNSSIRPDAIVLAKSGFGFTRKAKGNHGGLSKEEVFVPVLTRNISIGQKGQVVKLSELLLGVF